MQQLSSLRAEVELWNGLARRTQDANELLEMAADDAEMLAELEREAAALEAEINEREFALAMTGPHDGGAAYLSIHAGAGGTEAQDWAAMLLRMYLRWAEKKNFKVAMMDTTEGEEAGIKSVTIEVDGPNAYGLLKSERGTHRLVRISPFDSNARRHTSFAKVEVVPVLDEDIDIEISPNEIQIDVFLSSGAGGQNVQKNQTAVRVLRGKLYDIEQARLDEEKARLKGKIVDANFGSQIRSYVLHPYQMVKDLRTDEETGNTSAVLDGEIDAFITAWLKQQVGEEA
jgi:peptide chain release factor 2